MVSGVLLAAAIGMLAFAGIGLARAVLIVSQDYTARISMEEIGITLKENDKAVANRDYHFDDSTKTGSWLVSSDELLSEVPDSPVFMKKYPEVLTVMNSKENHSKNHERIDEYVRITIYRYWLDKNGKKSTELSPNLIHLYLGDLDLDDPDISGYGTWIKDMDHTASTALRSETEKAALGPGERLVLYYNAKLPAGATTTPVTDSIAIDNSIATKVSAVPSADGRTITTTYDYDGAQFCLEVTADAVQDHNPVDAIRSAWGIDPAQIGLTNIG